MTDHAAEAVKAHHRVLAAQAEMAYLAHERDEAIREALANGVSAASLAAQLGLTRQRIYNMAKKGKAQE